MRPAERPAQRSAQWLLVDTAQSLVTQPLERMTALTSAMRTFWREAFNTPSKAEQMMVSLCVLEPADSYKLHINFL